MKLLTIGDSFTYGDELTDIKRAWPYILQTNLSCELTNLGKSSTGNTSMIRNVIENAADYDLIIVAWSHFARIEFADECGIYDTWPGHRGVMFTGQLAFRTDVLDYITRHHNDEYLYKQYLLNIILLQTYASKHNKKLLMLNTTIGQLTLHNRISLLPIIGQIDTQYFIGWPDSTMMEWTYGTPKGSNGHFLEEGHAIVADKIYEHIRSLGWI